MKSSTFPILALALGASLLGPVPPARAQSPSPPSEELPVEQAQRHFALGVKLHAEGDYAAALAQFWRAYELKPHFKVLYNVAQCSFELRDYVAARAALERYLAEGGSAVLSAERRARVDADLSDLARRVARLEIRSDVRGARVYVDGRAVGTTPLARPVEVNEGQRAVTLELADQGVRQRSILLAGGENKIVEVRFDQPAQRPSTISRASVRGAVATDAATPRLGTAFWSATTGALLLAGSAGVTGYLALRGESDRRDALNRPGANAAQLDEDRQRVQTLALTTDILLGGAALCTGLATALFLWGGADSPQHLTVGADRLVVSGTF